jgi:hypothetical protein
MTTKPIRNLVVISDLHIGCQLGLCHPDGHRLDNAGHYRPSRAQRRIWDIWQEFWGDWVPKVTHREPFDLLINGDLMDGVHHGSTSQWSHNLHDQANAAYDIIEPVRQKARHLYIVRGTPAHAGESGVEEERLAQRLRASPDRDGRFARWELWKKIDSYLVHATHHIGTTASSQHEVSAVNAELAALFTEAGRWGNQPPDVIVRSHRHRCSELRLPAERCYATAFVTAAWQLKTPFTFKVAGGRVTTPQIGGSIIRLGDEELHTRHFVKDIGRGRPEL